MFARLFVPLNFIPHVVLGPQMSQFVCPHFITLAVTY